MKKIITVLFAIGCSYLCSGQDIHFSQFNNAPLSLNPALTGAFNGKHRIAANYKSQWYNIEKTYLTYGLSYEIGILRNNAKSGFLGIGVQFYNDVAGANKMGLMQENLSIAYHLPLNNRNLLSAGIQSGFSQRRINTESMQWASQYDPSFSNGYNAAMTPGEPAAFGNKNYGEVSAGLLWTYTKQNSAASANDAKKVQLGIALYHINRPKQTYFDINDKKMFMKMAIHASSYIGFWNTSIALVPSAVWYKQGPSNEILAGTLVRFGLNGTSNIGTKKETALSVGAYYRVNDAVIAAAQFEWRNFLLGVSYDVNVSGLSSASKYLGGLEVALRYCIPLPDAKNSSLF
jgi:type IX secretion system PorP/SprF family membrane protein